MPTRVCDECGMKYFDPLVYLVMPQGPSICPNCKIKNSVEGVKTVVKFANKVFDKK